MKNMEGVEREAGASGGEEGGAVGGDAEGERTKSMSECKWRKVAQQANQGRSSAACHRQQR